MTDTGFLVTLALALVAAAIGAAIAVRLGQSAILGYVAAGLQDVAAARFAVGPMSEIDSQSCEHHPPHQIAERDGYLVPQPPIGQRDMGAQ